MTQSESIADKIKCFFGFHNLIVSEAEQKLLNDAMKDPFARALGLNRLSDGTEIVFKVCTKCGAKK